MTDWADDITAKYTRLSRLDRLLLANELRKTKGEAFREAASFVDIRVNDIQRMAMNQRDTILGSIMADLGNTVVKAFSDVRRTILECAKEVENVH